MAALIVLCALNARASLVFQADFNSESNVVTTGGTGVVINANPAQSNVDVSFSSATPLAAGAGGYLRLTDNGARSTGNRPAGVRFTPTAAANSFDSWYANTSTATPGSFDTLNGGFDFLFRTSSSANLLQNTFRFFDVDGGTSGYRLALSSNATNNLVFTLNQGGSSFLSAATNAVDGNSVSLAANTTYRIAGTISTDANGFVTMKLFLAAGDVAIDTNSSTHLLASKTSTVVLDATNSISSSFGSAAGFNFGLIDNLDPDLKTLDLDSFRIYNSLPASFPSSIPEPSSAALLLGGVIGMGVCVTRRRR
ncbi:MAG: PEP-CTERM sorting domain-containing protein [Rariglobus sp.]